MLIKEKGSKNSITMESVVQMTKGEKVPYINCKQIILSITLTELMRRAKFVISITMEESATVI